MHKTLPLRNTPKKETLNRIKELARLYAMTRTMETSAQQSPHFYKSALC